MGKLGAVMGSHSKDLLLIGPVPIYCTKDRVLACCFFVNVKVLRGLISAYDGLDSPKSSIEHDSSDMTQLGGLVSTRKSFSGHSIHGIPKPAIQIAGRNSRPKTTKILESWRFMLLTVGGVAGGRKRKAHSSPTAGLRAVVANTGSDRAANGWEPGWVLA